VKGSHQSTTLSATVNVEAMLNKVCASSTPLLYWELECLSYKAHISLRTRVLS
jgi:hypothetical protein